MLHTLGSLKTHLRDLLEHLQLFLINDQIDGSIFAFANTHLWIVPNYIFGPFLLLLLFNFNFHRRRVFTLLSRRSNEFLLDLEDGVIYRAYFALLSHTR